MRPDLILTQDLGRVCALPSGQVQAALRYLGWQARVLTLDPRSRGQVLDSILAVGRAAGVAGRAEITAAMPDLVVVAPCGYHLDGAAGQAHAAARALPGLPVWAIDADGIIVRPGPRLVTGVEALAAVLHPGAAAPAPPGTISQVT